MTLQRVGPPSLLLVFMIVGCSSTDATPADSGATVADSGATTPDAGKPTTDAGAKPVRYQGMASADVTDPFVLTVAGTTVTMDGTITSDTEAVFKRMLADHPQVTLLVMKNVPGSADDDANLAASRLIRARKLTTHVPADGDIASGGTDMFIAGAKRTIILGGKIGVHSWSGDVDGKTNVEGASLPMTHAEHKKYLAYYKEMGIDAAFYWFTLKAAPAAGMWTMTRAEIEKYKIATFVTKL